MAQPQSFKNHTRFDPLFHYFVMPIFLLNVVFTIAYVVRHRAAHLHSGLWLIVLSVGLFALAGLCRGYALKVQDRLIRTEERLRLVQLCSPGELAELESLTIDQYVGLRFASNPELPELARRAVRENLDRKQIKQSIVTWRTDNDRL